MSAPASKAKVLFIGIVQDGKVVEERSVAAGETVTLGASGKATFAAAVPSFNGVDFPLFSVREGHYHLHFTSAFKGKVTSKGERVTLEQVTGDAKAPHVEGVYDVVLDESDKGKIRVDPVTVLFKFVEPAVVPVPSPTVEKLDFRQRWLQDDSDPMFLGSLLLWSALGVVFSVLAMNTPVVQNELEDIPDRFTKIILDEAPPPSEETEVEEIKDEDALAKAAEKEKEKVEPEKGEADDVAKAKAQEKAKEDISQSSELFKQLQARLIATTGANSSGSVLLENSEGNYDDIAGRLAEAEQVGASLGDGSRVRGGPGTAGGTGDRDVGGVGTAADLSGGVNLGNAPTVAAPKGRVSAGDLDFTGGDVSEVGKVVRRYQGQLKYCYESSLKKNPGLSGRVVVAWVVEGGAAVDVDIAENTTGDDELADCIKGRVRRWAFEGVADGEAKTPFVFTPQD